MGILGQIDSLWRYPVKSMCGEELEEAFVGFSGVYGDRLFAFTSSACPKGVPYLTGREQREMLLYRPRFRDPDKAARPPNLAEAEALAPGVNPLFADPADLAVEVETPSGEVLGVDDPALNRMLAERMDDGHTLMLVRSERAMTDCRPVSLFSIQTARQLGDEIGTPLDKRRFRANIYLDLGSPAGFAEDSFVGRTMRIGSKVVISILERDPRCKMITLDPETAEPSGAVLRKVSRAHDGMAGIYGAVLVEGTVHRGDDIELVG
jgi:MOSC domain-containing protein